MAIFLVRFCFGSAPAFVLEVELEGAGREDEDFGGGSASVDLVVGGGSFERSDEEEAAGVVVVFKVSSPLSTSLP